MIFIIRIIASLLVGLESGLGEVTVRRILNIRKSGGRVRKLEDLGNIGKRLKKVSGYISF